jgi:hypothetical protein
MRASPSASFVHGATTRQHKVDHFAPDEDGDKEGGGALTVDYGGATMVADCDGDGGRV